MISFTAPFHDFITGGNSLITVKSNKTGKHFTYKVVAKIHEHSGDPIYFVSVLSGPDTYTYIGFINKNGDFRPKKGEESPSIKGFGWIWSKRQNEIEKDDTFEINHNGACARCGRPLTHPDSIKIGLGPFCLSKTL